MGTASALLVHALILYGFYNVPQQNIITADLFSPPTMVSIRFTQPVEKIAPEPVQEPIAPKRPAKPILQKVTEMQPEELNKIEPTAAPPAPVITSEPVNIEPVRQINVIPVVSEINLKGKRIPPTYPKRALRLHQEGVVFLHVLVSETGAQSDIKIIKPSAYALLNSAALKAVRQWRFEPTRIYGRPIKSWVEIPVEFKIR